MIRPADWRRSSSTRSDSRCMSAQFSPNNSQHHHHSHLHYSDCVVECRTCNRRLQVQISAGATSHQGLLSLTTSSQVAAGPSRLRPHATGCSATATRPVRTPERHVNVLILTLHRAASRSLTPPGQAIGYNRKRVSSFNRVSILKKNSSLTSLYTTTSCYDQVNRLVWYRGLLE